MLLITKPPYNSSNITEIVKESINGIPCEVEYWYGTEMVGFWAYGYWHPDSKYTGESYE